MNTFTEVSHALVGVGLATYGGMLLFLPGALTMIGWVIALTFFVGGIGLCAEPIYEAGKAIFGKAKEVVDNAVNSDEKQGKKPANTAKAQ